MLVYHLELIVLRFPEEKITTRPIFLKKQATACFAVPGARAIFVGFYSYLKDPYTLIHYSSPVTMS